jgi:hypothetical protein
VVYVHKISRAVWPPFSCHRSNPILFSFTYALAGSLARILRL